MRVYRSDDYERHNPSGFIARGTKIANPETPERAEILLSAVTGAGHEILPSKEFGIEPVKAIHDPGYLNYLENAWRMWTELPDYGPEIIPNVHPGRNMNIKPKAIVGLAGYYQTDTACPIGPGTWEGALATANTALSAADAVISDGGEDHAYALCRPPGHHAYADMAGGFCFLNNSAIAAQYCLDNGAKKVAILDVDVHHGNGTQGIFYNRDDVMTLSLHGDPQAYYPFYTGYEDEVGEGDGRGFNKNYPLPYGTGDEPYFVSLAAALLEIEEYEPDVLVVALGLDASEHDPLAFLQITTTGFRRIARAIGSIAKPTVLVQEGGYISDHLGANLAAFLEGFSDLR